MSTEVVKGSTTPSKREIALQLTCAIISNPGMKLPGGTESAADAALRLLSTVETQLKLRPTSHLAGD